MWEKQKSNPGKEAAKTEKKYKHLTIEQWIRLLTKQAEK